MFYKQPRVLSTSKLSRDYDADAIRKIDKVFVDGIHLPNCVAYNIDQGWAFNKIDGLWQPRQNGAITVTVKEQYR